MKKYILLFAFIGFVSNGIAASLIVGSLADSGPMTLRQHIADANSGDTIKFFISGTISLTSGELVWNKNLVIIGQGASVITINGGNTSRIFNITGGNNYIQGLTLEEAYSSGTGGAVIINSGNTTFDSCIFATCWAETWGGGISIEGSGIDSLTINNCVFNYAGSNFIGGALYTYNIAKLVVENSFFTDSWYDVFYLEQTDVTISNTTISANNNFNDGIMFFDFCNVEIINSTIANNNQPPALGGKINSTISIGNTIFDNGGDNCEPGVPATIISLGNNISNDNSFSTFFTMPTDMNNTSAQLKPLADNGGFGMTHAITGCSPATDAGDPAIAPATDQRGMNRINAPDIGAFEHQGGALTAFASLSEPLCFGDSNGVAVAVGMGGDQPYSFEWSTGSTMSSVADLYDGSHWLITTDSEGCKDTLNLDVNTPPELMADTTAVSHVTSNGGNDGLIKATALGGSPVYTYSWTPGGYNTSTIQDLTADTYCLTVTDNNGCIDTLCVTIMEPPVGIDELSSIGDYMTISNMGIGLFQIDKVAQIVNPSWLKVLDIQGREILHRDFNGENGMVVDLNPFGRGVYMLSVKSGNQVFRLKLSW